MNKNRGALDNDLLIFLGIFLFLAFVWVTMSADSEKSKQEPLVGIWQNINPNRTTNGGSGGSAGQGDPDVSGVGAGATVVIDGWTYTKSPWYGKVEIGFGSARSQSVAHKEYIVLSAARNNKTSVNITGWRLENGRARKITESNSGAKVLPSMVATIPKGAELFLLSRSTAGPIALLPGDKAIVTTGSLRTGGDLPVRMSFKTNLCTGYLADNERNEFIPALRRNCPRLATAPDIEKLSDACYDFARHYPTCHTPDTEPYRNYLGDLVKNHIDKNTEVSKLCRDWIVARSSYNACVANNFNQEDFMGTEWRVYLNRSWEMWDNDREVITLYDASGLLVDQLSY